jgi:hypothetical protein
MKVSAKTGRSDVGNIEIYELLNVEVDRVSGSRDYRRRSFDFPVNITETKADRPSE